MARKMVLKADSIRGRIKLLLLFTGLSLPGSFVRQLLSGPGLLYPQGQAHIGY